MNAPPGWPTSVADHLTGEGEETATYSSWEEIPPRSATKKDASNRPGRRLLVSPGRTSLGRLLSFYLISTGTQVTPLTLDHHDRGDNLVRRLRVLHPRAETPRTPIAESTRSSALYNELAVVFGMGSVSSGRSATRTTRRTSPLRVLSIDNLFDFLIVLCGFSVPRKYQQK